MRKSVESQRSLRKSKTVNTHLTYQGTLVSASTLLSVCSDCTLSRYLYSDRSITIYGYDPPQNIVHIGMVTQVTEENGNLMRHVFNPLE